MPRSSGTKSTTERPTARVEPEIFLSQHRRISDRLLDLDELKASGKAAIQTAKALGVNLDAYKTVRKLARWDRARAEKYLVDVLLYSRYLDLGLGDQIDLFGNSNSELLSGLTAQVVSEHKAWEAEKAGTDAGKSDEPSDNCPHQPGTELHQRWVVGWHDGQAYRREAEARGEKIIKPRKGGDANPEDNVEETD